MSESAQLVIVALVALSVGAFIPVLLALRATLKRLEHTLEALEGRAARVLDRAEANLAQSEVGLKAATETIEAAKPVAVAVGNLAATIEGIRATATKAAAIGAAVGPALAAAISAARNHLGSRSDHALDGDDEDLGDCLPPDLPNPPRAATHRPPGTGAAQGQPRG